MADIAEGNERKSKLTWQALGPDDYVDNGWPTTDPDDHPVSELATDRTGALSPFGDVEFPVPSTDLPYVHPVTVVNR